jgi:hypothetical protein
MEKSEIFSLKMVQKRGHLQKAKFSHSKWSKKGGISIDPNSNLKLGTTTGGRSDPHVGA